VLIPSGRYVRMTNRLLSLESGVFMMRERLSANHGRPPAGFLPGSAAIKNLTRNKSI
jgi:hypothetical protein